MKVFLSHSSLDKPVARRISSALVELGIEVWLDEWEIKVGDPITKKIQDGLKSSNFVAVLLSPNGIKSGWVDREWQSRISHEIKSESTIILPILIEDCEIPPLLGDKKYADFRHSFQDGMEELKHVFAIPPSAKKVLDATVLGVSKKHYFLLGVFVGQKWAMIIPGSNADSRLFDFFSTATQIGVDKAILDEVRMILTLKNEADRSMGRRIINQYLKGMDSVTIWIDNHGPYTGKVWFHIGRLIYASAALRLVSEQDEKPTSVADSILSLIDEVDVKPRMKILIERFCEAEQDGADGGTLLNLANSISMLFQNLP